MNEAGVAILEVEDLLAGSSVTADDARLTEARDLLKQRMAGVVSKTHEHFGDPLGLLMIYVASGQNAERNVVLSGAGVERLDVNLKAPSGEIREAAYAG